MILRQISLPNSSDLCPTHRLREHGIYGHNDYRVYTSDVQDCEEMCRNETFFLCLSTDYNVLTGICFLSKDNSLSASTSVSSIQRFQYGVLSNRCMITNIGRPTRKMAIIYISKILNEFSTIDRFFIYTF